MRILCLSGRKLLTIAIAGNPNCGKTALFNALTGARQRVGNWPGVTVEKKEGYFELGDRQIRLVDLPGTYALFANAEDERAAVDSNISTPAYGLCLRVLCSLPLTAGLRECRML